VFKYISITSGNSKYGSLMALCVYTFYKLFSSVALFYMLELKKEERILVGVGL
jgi:hypothetical protein